MREPGFIDYIGDSVVVLGHHNADPDAIGAAQGIKELIEKLKPETSVHVLMPEDISRLSRQIIEGLELELYEKYSGEYDTVVVVDSGSLNQLGEWETAIKDHEQVTILIDHHEVDSELTEILDLMIHDNEANSTCEIIYRLYEKYQIKPSTGTAKALLAGIAFDTRFFSIGGSNAYDAVSSLLEIAGDVADVLSLFRVESDISERIARLKAAQRAEIQRVEDWVIVFSEVSSFQASAARALVSLGADLAVVVGVEGNKLRASLRSTQRFHNGTGLHLGVMISRYSEEHGGSGSGHPTAAGYNGVGGFDDFKANLLARLVEEIK